MKHSQTIAMGNQVELFTNTTMDNSRSQDSKHGYRITHNDRHQQKTNCGTRNRAERMEKTIHVRNQINVELKTKSSTRRRTLYT